jgi:hypothetical protein
MIIFGRGGIVVDAVITIKKGDRVFDTTFINCAINDSEVQNAWAEDCIFQNCRFKSDLSNLTKGK